MSSPSAPGPARPGLSRDDFPAITESWPILCGSGGLSCPGLRTYRLCVRPRARGVPICHIAAFSGERALAYTAELTTLFPDRAPGHPGRPAVTIWLAEQFRVLGYEPQLHFFDAWIYGVHHKGLANIWAIRPGRSSEAIAVFAHYDVPAFAPGGAADDGSGVGSVLELARVFAAENPARTILFILTDVEDYGMAGARAFVSQKPYPGPIVAGVGLDFVNSGAPSHVSIGFGGTQTGYTPPWLRNLAFRAVNRFVRVTAPGPVDEWIERTVAISAEDSGTFLQAGIPVLNLGVVAQDRKMAMSVFHTVKDTPDMLHVEGFDWWGRAAELIVRSVAEQPTLPRGAAASMLHFGLSGDGSTSSYLPGWAWMAVQALLLMPLWVSAKVGWYLRMRGGIRRGLRAVVQGSESKAAWGAMATQSCRLLALATCLAAGLVAMKVMRLAGVVARFEVYPATSKDPYLCAPHLLPLAVAFAAMGLTWLVVSRYTRWLGGGGRGAVAGAPGDVWGWSERHLALVSVLATLTFVVWASGAGSAAVTFFILPAYLWLLLPDYSRLTGGARGAARAAGGLLVFLSAAVYMVFIYIFQTSYYTGPLWWYLPLAATHGLISWKSSLVFLFSAALHWDTFRFAAGVSKGVGSRLVQGGEIGLPLRRG